MAFKPVAKHIERHKVTSGNSGNELKLENYNAILESFVSTRFRLVWKSGLDWARGDHTHLFHRVAKCSIA